MSTKTSRAILMESIERMTEFGSAVLPGKKIPLFTNDPMKMKGNKFTTAPGKDPVQGAFDRFKAQEAAKAAAKRRAEVAREIKAKNEATRKRKAEEEENRPKGLYGMAYNALTNLDNAKERRGKIQSQYEAAKARKDRAAASRYQLKIDQLDIEIKRLQKLYDNIIKKATKERGERLSKSFERMGEGAQFVSWSTRMTATPMPNQVSRKFINGGYFLA